MRSFKRQIRDDHMVITSGVYPRTTTSVRKIYYNCAVDLFETMRFVNRVADDVMHKILREYVNDNT